MTQDKEDPELPSSSSGASSSGSEDGDTVSAAVVPLMADFDYRSGDDSDETIGPIPDLERLTSEEHQQEQDEEQLKRDEERREKNRDAARRCRKRRGDQMKVLTKEKKYLEDSNDSLCRQIERETESIKKMKKLLQCCKCQRSLPSLSLQPYPASTGLVRHQNGLVFQTL